MPTVVMLIRHAEKPLDAGPPFGVTDQGAVDRESLTPRGWQRAGALVRFFAAGAGRASNGAGLPVPDHLFASKVGAGSSSRRPLETLEPLAAALGLEIDTSILKPDIAGLATAILARTGTVLVSWEHHLIPGLTELLTGAPSPAPAIWPDERYDVVWVLRRESDAGPFAFSQVCQMLLAGDADRAI